MRVLRLSLVVSVFLASAAVAARAQSDPASDAPPPLHLADAIAWARDHHPSLGAAHERVAAARQGPVMAKSLMPPMVDAQIWQWPVTSINPADTNMYMFMVEQDLPGRGKRALRAAAADRAVDRAAADADVRDRAVVTGVEEAYARLRATEREIAATRAVQPAAHDLVRATEASYAAGRGMQAMVVRATLARTELDERLAMLEAEAERGRVALNVAMGRAPDAPMGALDDTPPPARVPPLEALIAQAGEAHPELGAGRAAIAEAEAGLAVANAAHTPDWSLQGGYMLMPGGAGAWSARVGLTWPTAPWAKKGIAARSAEAEAEARAARADLENTRQQIAGRVGEARAELAGALARLAVVRGTMRPQAVHLLDAARLAFAAGQAPLSDVLEAQRLALDADVAVARLSGEADVAWAALETAVGADLLPLNASAVPAADGGQE